MKKIIFCCLLTICLTSSCSDFLELKPDKRMFVPQKAEDLWALLDNVGYMNMSSPLGTGEMASDNFFVTDAVWAGIIDMETKAVFTWDRYPVERFTWRSNYQRISYANVVLEHLERIPVSPKEETVIRGTAKFIRALAHYELLQIFAKAYSRETAEQTLGIPIRLTADINVPAHRSNLADSYSAVVQDLDEAVLLLTEDTPTYPTRPNRTAAFAALARIYLAMQDYPKAGKAAQEALKSNNRLMDYNLLALDRSYPFDPFNKEVLYFATMTGLGLTESRIRVDTNLYKSYADIDLRKKAYFTKNTDGYQMFTGNFSQETSASKFCGLSTSEVLLIASECAARMNNKGEAVSLINRLIQNRYKDGATQLGNNLDNSLVLSRILEERRKELVFRGVRWSDLRRLEDRSIIKRVLEKKEYTMNAEQLRNFAFLIPTEVMERSDIQQN